MLPDPSQLPCKIGQSPFHTKGSGFTGAIEAYNRMVPGGAAAVFSQLPTQELRDFFSQRFLAASWYDIVPLIYAEKQASETAGRDFESFVEEGTKQHAERDLRGIYKVFLKTLSPGLTVRGLIRLSQMLLDFGTSEVGIDGNTAVIEIKGVPALLARWQQVVSASYLTVALKKAGAQEVQFKATTENSVERRGGFPLVDGKVNLTWR